MVRMMIAPNKYIQGRGILSNIYKYTENMGSKFFIIISQSGAERFSQVLKKSFGGEGKLKIAIFGGNCTKVEIERLRDDMRTSACDVVIGVGGGKIHDTAKAVSFYEKAPLVIVPTVASTDAPTSALSVIYTNEGVMDEYLFIDRNPDLVLVDVESMVEAPTRLLVSGMGDALATKFETRAVKRANKKAMAGGLGTKAAVALSNLAYEILIDQGYEAKLASENKVVTKAFENVIEANTLLSGLGFESGGLAAAHAVHDGLTTLKSTKDLYHGELVSFGVLVQLVLENAPKSEIEELLYFCNEVGLPTTFEDINISDVKEGELKYVSRIIAGEGSTIHNMPFSVNEEDVFAAMVGANAIGRSYK